MRHWALIKAATMPKLKRSTIYEILGQLGYDPRDITEITILPDRIILTKVLRSQGTGNILLRPDGLGPSTTGICCYIEDDVDMVQPTADGPRP